MNDRGNARSGVVLGAALVIAGSILLLERLDLLDTNLLRHFWPLMIMAVGTLLFTAGRELFGGMIVFIGAILELQKMGIVRVHIFTLWPLFIIALGALLLYRALFPPKPGRDRGVIVEPLFNEYAVLGGNDIMVNSQNFEGGSATSILGGNEIDLRNAKITNSPAIMHCDAILGGISLKVPVTWRVTSNGQAILGGIEVKTLTPQNTGEPEQHLIIKGLAVMGGVEVRN